MSQSGSSNKWRNDEIFERLRAVWSSPSPILCVVGPPGAGKTTLLRRFAEAVDETWEPISVPKRDSRASTSSIDGRLCCLQPPDRSWPHDWFERRVAEGRKFVVESRFEPLGADVTTFRLAGVDGAVAAALSGADDTDESTAELIRLVGGLPTALKAIAQRRRTHSIEQLVSLLCEDPEELLSVTKDGERLVSDWRRTIDDRSPTARDIVGLAIHFGCGIELAVFRKILRKSDEITGGVDEAFDECLRWGLIERDDDADTVGVAPMARLLHPRDESRDQPIAYPDEMAIYVTELHQRLVTASTDREITRYLSGLEQEAPQLFSLMKRQRCDGFDWPAEIRERLLRLLVEHGLRNGATRRHRTELCAIVEEISTGASATPTELESAGRWLRAVGRLDDAEDVFRRAVDFGDRPSPRLFWRWAEVLRLLQEVDQLDAVVSAGIEAADRGDESRPSTWIINLELTDRSSDEVDEFIDAPGFSPEAIRLREDDALHRVDEYFQTLRSVARRHWARHHFEKQRRFAEAGKKRAMEIDDRGWLARFEHTLGSTLDSQGERTRALQHYRSALVGYERLGFAVERAYVLTVMALLDHTEDRVQRALEMYRRARNAFLELDANAVAVEAHNLYGFGCALFETEKINTALRHLERARAINSAARRWENAGRTSLVEAWIETWAGDRSRARRRFEEALKHFRNDDPHGWKVLVELSQTELLDGSSADRDDGEWEERLADVPPESPVRYLCSYLLGNPLASPMVRRLRRSSFATRVLMIVAEPESVERRKSERREDSELVVGPEACWFEVPGRDRVDLRSRGSRRRIFGRLVQLYLGDPGEPLSVEELFEIGWPDETATAESAANRVYWAIHSLRKMGLEDFITNSDGGYLLDHTRRISARDNR